MIFEINKLSFAGHPIFSGRLLHRQLRIGRWRRPACVASKEVRLHGADQSEDDPNETASQ